MSGEINLILTSMFNGIGTALGLTVFEFYIKPRLQRAKELHERFLGGLKNGANRGTNSN